MGNDKARGCWAQGFLAHAVEVPELPCEPPLRAQGLLHQTVKKSHVNAVSATERATSTWSYCHGAEPYHTEHREASP